MIDSLFLKKKNQVICTLFAPVNGKIIPETEIPDEAFSTGMLGEGLGIIPNDGYFVSPASGTVSDVTPTGHAYSIITDDGAEILLHIGIDTVELKGEGFRPSVKSGDRIKAGDPIVTVDLDAIKSKGYSTTTAMIIINPEEFSQITVFEGACKASIDEIMKFVGNRKNPKKE